MKSAYLKLLLLFCLVSETLCAQQQPTGVIKIRKKISKVMCLNGYTDGTSPPHAICGGKGLYVTNTDQYSVKSFVILVETVREIEVKMNGNVVAGDICETIGELKTNDIVYINKIVAVDNTTGKEVNMPPLKFQIRSALLDDKKQRYKIMQEDNH